MNPTTKYRVYQHLCNAVINIKQGEIYTNEGIIIKSYFTNLLRLVKEEGDLKLLLPSQLLSVVEEYIGVPSKVTSLSTDRVYAFNQTHKKEICLLKQRMLLNMLED